ncbi:hypothetical protein NDU88_003027 [Pleurodeles waltl]|uniref:Uncharacterized protein n=1 Tax=Pleurodeles waltl TaxID=8319 RepID=A0AAV7NFM5_PLEWA|nr:hypothetical protein NDU88_003027 [Pleurodeles waltl]
MSVAHLVRFSIGNSQKKVPWSPRDIQSEPDASAGAARERGTQRSILVKVSASYESIDENTETPRKETGECPGEQGSGGMLGYSSR